MTHPAASSTRWLAVVLIAGALAACNGKNPFQGVLPSPSKAAGPLWEEPQFGAMMEAYRKALPGKRRVLVFSIDRERGQLQVQDPAKPENVDAYQYRNGQLQGPIPVRLMGGGKLEANLFDWDEVAVDRIPELVKTAFASVPLEGERVVQIHVGRDLKVHVDPIHGGAPLFLELRIRISLEGTRRFGSLVADAKGNVISAKAQ